MPRHVQHIAQEILDNWEKPYYGAVPYLQAMLSIISIDDTYGADSARDVVRYFLSNATAWRGETARRIKKELNDMLK